MSHGPAAHSSTDRHAIWPTCRVKDARRFLDKHKRVDIAMDAFYNDAAAMASAVKNQTESSPSTSKLNALFDTYKGMCQF